MSSFLARINIFLGSRASRALFAGLLITAAAIAGGANVNGGP